MSIMTNLSLGSKREMHKMMSSGLLTTIVKQLNQKPPFSLLILCLQTLGNIAITHSSFVDMIISREPLILHRVCRAKANAIEDWGRASYAVRFRVNQEIVFFVSSLVEG